MAAWARSELMAAAAEAAAAAASELGMSASTNDTAEDWTSSFLQEDCECFDLKIACYMWRVTVKSDGRGAAWWVIAENEVW
jgi:hypothetical protein